MRISDWSSDVCSSDLLRPRDRLAGDERRLGEGRIEPVDDREALDERRAVDLERRHESLRVDRQIVRAVMGVAAQADGPRLVRDLLEPKTDTPTVARRRAQDTETQEIGQREGRDRGRQ